MLTYELCNFVNKWIVNKLFSVVPHLFQMIYIDDITIFVLVNQQQF